MKFQQLPNGYKVTDLYLAAALLSGVDGITSEGIEKIGKSDQCWFVLSGDPAFIKVCIDDFFEGKLSLPDCYAYASQVRRLKNLIFNKTNHHG